MHTLVIFAALVLMGLPAAANDSETDSFAIAMAQHLLLDYFPRPDVKHLALTFGASSVHARSGDGRWVVIGTFMADRGDNGYRPHIFIAMVGLACLDRKKPKCWKLHKLAIDNRIVALRDQPIPSGSAADKQ